MNQIIISGLILLSFAANAHNPQISVATIIQQTDSNWTGHVGVALSAVQYELHQHYPQMNWDALSDDALQRLLAKHIRENFIIIANGAVVDVRNVKIRLGHQTDVGFALEEMPDHVTSLRIRYRCFAENPKHQAILRVRADGNSEKFRLGKDNDFSVSLMQESNRLTKIDDHAATSWHLTIPFLVSLLLISLIVGTYLIYVRRTLKSHLLL